MGKITGTIAFLYIALVFTTFGAAWGFYFGYGIGYDEGAEYGLHKGEWDGYFNGLNVGKSEGLNKGFVAGSTVAYAHGYLDGSTGREYSGESFNIPTADVLDEITGGVVTDALDNYVETSVRSVFGDTQEEQDLLDELFETVEKRQN